MGSSDLITTVRHAAEPKDLNDPARPGACAALAAATPMRGDENGRSRISALPKMRGWNLVASLGLWQRGGADSLQGVGVFQPGMWIQHPDRQRGDHSGAPDRAESQIARGFSAPTPQYFDPSRTTSTVTSARLLSRATGPQ